MRLAATFRAAGPRALLPLLPSAEQESSRYDEELTQGHGRGEVETVLRAGPLIVYELQLQTNGNDGISLYRFPEAKRDFDTSCRLQSGAYSTGAPSAPSTVTVAPSSTERVALDRGSVIRVSPRRWAACHNFIP